jgi:hypothetical protein
MSCVTSATAWRPHARSYTAVAQPLRSFSELCLSSVGQVSGGRGIGAAKGKGTAVIESSLESSFARAARVVCVCSRLLPLIGQVSSVTSLKVFNASKCFSCEPKACVPGRSVHDATHCSSCRVESDREGVASSR